VSGDIAQPFLISVFDEGEWLASRSRAFTPGVRVSSTHWIRDRVGLRASLDIMKKRRNYYPYEESNPYSSLVWTVILFI
jgi:hypothetical protein